MIESVVAVLEVKAALRSRDEVRSALDNLDSVKSLDRTGKGLNYDRARIPIRLDDKRHVVRRIDPSSFHCQVFAGIVTERSIQSPEAVIETVFDYIKDRPRTRWPNIYAAIRQHTLSYLAPNDTPTEDPMHADRLSLLDPVSHNSDPPLVILAGALADILRVSVEIDYVPTNYFPLSSDVTQSLQCSLPDDLFPGRQDPAPRFADTIDVSEV